jgi:hypothetical protein
LDSLASASALAFFLAAVAAFLTFLPLRVAAAAEIFSARSCKIYPGEPGHL